jgi:hypothetical protein
MPIRKGWSNTPLPADELASEFKNPQANIGILMGQVSGNLIDVDLDCPEAVAIAPDLLPPTEAIFGRASRGASHRLYQVNTPIKSERISFDKNVLLELRSDGAQTMVPPSLHPSGENVTWIKSGPAALVEADDLLRRVRYVAAGVILINAWPTAGTRHDLSLGIAASMAKAGIDQDFVEDFIRTVCEHANDEESAARVRNVRDAFDRVSRGENTYGLPKMAEIIGQNAASEFSRLIGLKASRSESKTPGASSPGNFPAINESLSLWVSPDDVGYATIKFKDHSENWKIRGRQMRRWLIRNVRRPNNKPLTRTALEQVIDELDAQAQHGLVHETYIRIAGQGDEIYIDLCDEAWRVIQIGKDCWRIVDNPPVKFIRTLGMRALPVPEPGKIEALRPFLNVETSDDFVLFVAAMLGALLPGIPYVVLMISGEQGTAKTTVSHVFRRLVDPNSAPVRSLPRTEHDIFISATNSWLLVFDNVSYIPSSIADALCRIATGGSFVTRRLYSDDEEVLLAARRPTLLNGIPALSNRPDLLDRSILLTLPLIEPEQRKPEKQFKAEFEAAAPGIFGALCSALSSVLKNRADVKLETSPRMADFAVAITAAEAGLGWETGTFIAAYEANLELAMIDLASQDPLIEAISKCLATREGLIIEPATELLRLLEGSVTTEEARKRNWPKQPNQLTRSLRRLAPVMRSMGIEVELDFERDRETHVKRIRISSAPPRM